MWKVGSLTLPLGQTFKMLKNLSLNGFGISSYDSYRLQDTSIKLLFYVLKKKKKRCTSRQNIISCEWVCTEIKMMVYAENNVQKVNERDNN